MMNDGHSANNESDHAQAQGVSGLILCAFCFEKLWEIDPLQSGRWLVYPAQIEVPLYSDCDLCPFCGQVYMIALFPHQRELLIKDSTGHVRTQNIQLKRSA